LRRAPVEKLTAPALRRAHPVVLGVLALLLVQPALAGAAAVANGDQGRPTQPAPDPGSGGVTLRLPPLTETERGWAADPNSIPVHARLGFGRAVPEGALSMILEDAGHWQAAGDGGRRLTVRVTSPGAAGLQLGRRVDALPDGVMLAVAGTAQAALAPAVLSGAEIKASLARDAAAQRNEEARDDTRPRR
jgi:hypothetical protein